MSDKKKLACFDVDGTIFRSSLLIELVSVLIEQKLFPELAREVFDDEEKEWLQRKGDYDSYIEAVVATFLKHIKGIKIEDLENAATIVINRKKDHVYRYTRDLIHTLKTDGYFLLAVSHSPKIILDKFCVEYGFDKVYGKRYAVDAQNMFTGETLDAGVITNKAAIISRACEKDGLSLKDSVGVGDTETDIPMLELVTHRICFNPNTKLLTHAKKNNWSVVVERKDVTYNILGNAYPIPNRTLH